MEREFKSRLEELVGGKVKELRFPSSAGFRPFQRFFCEEAAAHPAKANLYLLYFLVKNYTNEGDVVADIMAGIGSTGIIASYLCRHSVLVELESKFVKWIKKNVDLLEKYGKKKGEIRVIQGDARRLSELLGVKTDSIVTIPPYSNAISRQGESSKVDHIGISCRTAREYPDNIGNLKHGDIDAIITSPPYSGSVNAPNDPERRAERMRKAGLDPVTIVGGKARCGQVDWRYGESEGQIGKLAHGKIDAVITSPPYGHEATASKKTKLEEKGEFKMGHSKEVPYTDEDYRSWERHEGGNIAKRKLFIRVPCSPEEAQFHDTRPGRKGTIWEYTKEVEATPEMIEKVQNLKSRMKGRSETYLEAMFKVYSECYKILKPGGRIIIIVKPFVRNKRVVDLPWHTWLLLQRCGFRLIEVLKFRLPTISFWRILYERRFPNVPRIIHEYILVMCKPRG